ncbi:DUF4190 domain-containing protein [Salana multivorans]
MTVPGSDGPTRPEAGWSTSPPPTDHPPFRAPATPTPARTPHDGAFPRTNRLAVTGLVLVLAGTVALALVLARLGTGAPWTRVLEDGAPGLFPFLVTTALAGPLAGAICGQVARRQLRRRPGQRGHGAAVTATAIGWTMTAIGVVVTGLIIVMVIALASH